MDELNLGGDVCILYLYLGLLGFRFLSFFRLPWRRRQWHPTPVFLPGRSQGRRSLVGCCPWGRTESDTTEVTQQQQQQASLVAQMVKNLPAMQETWVRSLGWEDPLEKGMATHSSILFWRIPWTADSGGPQSMGPQRVRQTEFLTLSLFIRF